MVELNVTGGTVELGDLGLRTPNLVGTAEVLDATAGEGLRAAGGTSPALLDALERNEMVTTHAVELQATEAGTTDTRAGPDRGGGGSAGEIQLDVPQPNQGWEQAVLSVDERGIATWSFAPVADRAPASRGGGPARTFVIRRTPGPPPEPGEDTSRSLLGEAGKQVLKVIAFPIGQAAGRMANNFIGDWERKHQGYGIRGFASADYRSAGQPFDGDTNRWQQLAAGRTLLFIHGTFSRAAGAFGGLPQERMDRLQQLYDGRVIAFDHLSISEDPRENIDWLIDKIPPGQTLDVDVVAHSRGGLVARSLAQRGDGLPGNRRINVHRMALVGAVNNGTILADVSHWNDLVDTLSTVLNIAGIAVGETLDLVLSFVRQIALAAYPELRGLSAMVPGGQFLSAFNGEARGTTEYLAIGSNYEPTDRRLKSWANDVVKDLIFEGHPNDAMVRMDSICGSTVAGEFLRTDLAEVIEVEETAGVEHSGYFANDKVGDGLVAWLQAGLPGR